MMDRTIPGLRRRLALVGLALALPALAGAQVEQASLKIDGMT